MTIRYTFRGFDEIQGRYVFNTEQFNTIWCKSVRFDSIRCRAYLFLRCRFRWTSRCFSISLILNWLHSCTALVWEHFRLKLKMVKLNNMDPLFSQQAFWIVTMKKSGKNSIGCIWMTLYLHQMLQIYLGSVFVNRVWELNFLSFCFCFHFRPVKKWKIFWGIGWNDQHSTSLIQQKPTPQIIRANTRM